MVPADYFFVEQEFSAQLTANLFVPGVGKRYREPGANKSSQHLNEALSLVSSTHLSSNV